MAYRMILIVFLLLVGGEASAQEWRRVVPLQTNCADLKRVLGISTCLNSTYDFPDAKVTIEFSDGTCATGWNVAKGTVLSVQVHPKTRMHMRDLHLNQARYKKTVDEHLTEVTYYENEDEGTSVAVFSDGTVASLSYGPSIKDKTLECSSKADPVRPPRASIKFDEYESLSTKEEEARLDNFVTELLASPNFAGHVIAYGRQGRPREAHDRAARVKDYVVSRGVANDRLSIVEGGERARWTIELFLVFRN